MILLLLLTFLPQEEVTISRAYKGPYQDAVREYARAIELIPNTPTEAVEAFTRVIENRKIKYMECLLRIELRVGNYRIHDFFPFQFRGRALMKLAEKAKNKTDAQTHYEQAQADFEESIKRGMKSSQAYLDENQKQLTLLKKNSAPPPTPVNPEIAFQKKWKDLTRQDQFRAAREFIEQEGQFLSPIKKDHYIKETDHACRNHLSKTTTLFLADLEQLVRQKKPFNNLSRTLQKEFRLPQEETLTTTSPPYTWCHEVRKTFLQSEKARQVRIATLIDHAIESIPLTETPETNPWLIAVGTLAHGEIRNEIKKHLTEARNAPRERRLILNEQALQLTTEWTRLENRLQDHEKPSPFGNSINKEIKSQIDLFPADYTGFAQLEIDLEKSIRSSDPEKGFLEIEQSLERSRSKWQTLSIESRQEIIRYMILCRGLRRFFTGKNRDEIANELTALGTELKEIGGSFVLTRFGPKISDLFEKLGK